MTGMRYFFEDCDKHMFTLGESCPACRVEQLERSLAAAQAVIEAAREINEWEDHPHLKAALEAYDAAREQP